MVTQADGPVDPSRLKLGAVDRRGAHKIGEEGARRARPRARVPARGPRGDPRGSERLRGRCLFRCGVTQGRGRAPRGTGRAPGRIRKGPGQDIADTLLRLGCAAMAAKAASSTAATVLSGGVDVESAIGAGLGTGRKRRSMKVTRGTSP